MVQVFIDKTTGSELCSDGYPIGAPFGDAQFESVAFEARSRLMVKGQETFGIACNVDEDAGEGATAEGDDAAAQKVNDIVDSFQLQEVPGCDKKFFKSYFATYMKNVLLPAVPAEEVESFKRNIQALFMKMLSEFDNSAIYQPEKVGEVDDPTLCMPVFAYWLGEEEAPRFIYFKHGVKVEKY